MYQGTRTSGSNQESSSSLLSSSSTTMTSLAFRTILSSRYSCHVPLFSNELYLVLFIVTCLGNPFFFSSVSLVQAEEKVEHPEPVEEAKGPQDYDYIDYGLRDDALRPKFRSRHFTPIIAPKEDLCFFVTLKQYDTLTVTMQVLRGGDLKIWLVLRNFVDKKHIDPKPPTKSAYRVYQTPEDGQYEVCLNNKFTMAHTKVVSVDIAIAQELKDDYEEPPHSAEGKEAVKGTEADDPFQNPDKVDDAAETIRALEKMLHRVKWLQSNVGRGRFEFMKFKGQMMKDAYYKQDQLKWVNIWSGLVCGSLVLVYLIEVHLIKRMFRDSNKNVISKTGMKMGL